MWAVCTTNTKDVTVPSIDGLVEAINVLIDKQDRDDNEMLPSEKVLSDCNSTIAIFALL